MTARETLKSQPILHAPTEEPDRHWKTVGRETQDVIVEGRRPAMQSMPTDKARMPDLFPHGSPTAPKGLIDRLRDEVGDWRQANYAGASQDTSGLLLHLASGAERETGFRLHFAQLEAVETLAYLTEMCDGAHFMVRHLRQTSVDCNRGLKRLACRMATGTGKTLVMACMIAYHAVNRGNFRNVGSALARSVDRVVVVCPGRTILSALRDRLRPGSKGNVYDRFMLVPNEMRSRLQGFKVDVVNFESLQPREDADLRCLDPAKGMTARQRNRLLGREAGEARETHHEMWTRKLRLGGSRNGRERILVLNDEGHHCRAQNGGKDGIWMTALLSLKTHPSARVLQAVDLSATPMFVDPRNDLGADGCLEDPDGGRMFPWTVSECGLAEAIESGLVKIPRLPSKARGNGELRELFQANHGRPLKDRGSRKKALDALSILYADYERTFEAWKRKGAEGEPVLIVVANTRANAEAFHEMIGGKRHSDGTVSDGAGFPLLSNVVRNQDDVPVAGIPRTMLVVSGNSSEKSEGGGLLEQVKRESRIGLAPVKGEAAPKAEEVQRALQTVAQPGEPGESIRCVVSVGMLTEGWDCQRVTQILGYRKFGSQLLCEQTLGRALRRSNHESRALVRNSGTGRETERFLPEYAAVLGVPFSTVPAEGGEKHVPPPTPYEVRPSGKPQFRIEFPRFLRYGIETDHGRLFFDESKVGDTEVPEVSRKAGDEFLEGAFGSGKKAKGERRECAGEWLLARDLAKFAWRENLLGAGGRSKRTSRPFGQPSFLFADAREIVKGWTTRHPEWRETLHCPAARQALFHALSRGLSAGKPVFRKFGISDERAEGFGSASDWKPFRSRLQNKRDMRKSELNKAACHSALELRIAAALEEWDEVCAITRNHGEESLKIPYRFRDSWLMYIPDFLVRLDRKTKDGRTLHVVVEGKGVPDDASEAKKKWTREWWLEAANLFEEERGSGNFWIHAEIGPEDRPVDPMKASVKEASAGNMARRAERPECNAAEAKAEAR